MNLEIKGLALLKYELWNCTPTCAELVAELYMAAHHREGDKVLHFHLLSTAKEHQAIRVHGFEFHFNAQVVVDVGKRWVCDVRLLAVKRRRCHQRACTCEACEICGSSNLPHNTGTNGKKTTPYLPCTCFHTCRGGSGSRSLYRKAG